MLLFCNRNDRNLITLENRFYHVILASNIGNHTCLEHYAGIRGIVLCVHHPRHSTPQDLYNSSTNICVCALYELYSAGLQRYIFITDIHIYICTCLTLFMGQCLPKNTENNQLYVNRLTPSGLCQVAVGDLCEYAVDQCIRLQELPEHVRHGRLSPVHKTWKKSKDSDFETTELETKKQRPEVSPTLSISGGF